MLRIAATRSHALAARWIVRPAPGRAAAIAVPLTGIEINETGSEIRERQGGLEALQKPAAAEDLVGNTLGTQCVPDGCDVDRDHGLS